MCSKSYTVAIRTYKNVNAIKLFSKRLARSKIYNNSRAMLVAYGNQCNQTSKNRIYNGIKCGKIKKIVRLQGIIFSYIFFAGDNAWNNCSEYTQNCMQILQWTLDEFNTRKTT